MPAEEYEAVAEDYLGEDEEVDDEVPPDDAVEEE